MLSSSITNSAPYLQDKNRNNAEVSQEVDFPVAVPKYDSSKDPLANLSKNHFEDEDSEMEEENHVLIKEENASSTTVSSASQNIENENQKIINPIARLLAPILIILFLWFLCRSWLFPVKKMSNSTRGMSGGKDNIITQPSLEQLLDGM